MFKIIKKYKVALLFIVTAVLLGVSYYLSSTNPDKPQEKVSAISEKAVSTDNSRICSGEIIPESAEGPYYKSGSPERTIIYSDGTTGKKITIRGYVYDQDCNPISKAWLDFWQADGNGDYDNQGYNLRGNQSTDSDGRYELETKLPGEYTGRTPHIHVKLRATENGKIYTSQLYFPTSVQNNTDSIFDNRMLVEFTDEENRQARFDFVIDAN